MRDRELDRRVKGEERQKKQREIFENGRVLAVYSRARIIERDGMRKKGERVTSIVST